jgi:hypothetical protein
LPQIQYHTILRTADLQAEIEAITGDTMRDGADNFVVRLQ